MWYVMATKQEGTGPCDFDGKEYTTREEAFAAARAWHAEGRIVRVLELAPFGLYHLVDPKVWLTEGGKQG